MQRHNLTLETGSVGWLFLVTGLVSLPPATLWISPDFAVDPRQWKISRDSGASGLRGLKAKAEVPGLDRKLQLTQS